MNIKSSIARIAALTGFALGAFALSAFATGTWTAAPSTPPNQNADAPLNVGTSAQVKNGDVSVNAFLANLNSSFLKNVSVGGILSTAKLQLTTGAGNGKILQSDASGNATWVATSTFGSGGGASGVAKILAGNDISVSPSTGVGAVTVSSAPSVDGACYLSGLGDTSNNHRPLYVGVGDAQGAAGNGTPTGRFDGSGCTCPSGYSPMVSGSFEEQAIWYATGYICVQ